MNELFNYTLHAGPTRTTSTQVALDDLTMVTTKLLADTGNFMDISVTTGSLSRGGVFSILTDNRIVIKKVSEAHVGTDKDTGRDVIEYTSLKLPAFEEPTVIYRGGKVFYLYQAGGVARAINLPRDKTTLFRIKYESYVAPVVIPEVIPTPAAIHKFKYIGALTAFQGTSNAPAPLDNNTVYYYAHKVHGGFERSIEGREVPIGDHLTLPANPVIGDVVELNIHNLNAPHPDPVYYVKVADKESINGVVLTDWFRIAGSTVRFTYTGEDALGWAGIIITHIY